MIIVPANTLAAGGFEVANSCRFNSGDSAYMHKTMGTPTNDKKWTWSGWVKRCTSGEQQILFEGVDDGANYDIIELGSSDQLKFKSVASSSESANQTTNMLFRDPAAWYHIVVAQDSTQASAGNRLKIYVNGTQVTSLATDTQMPEDHVNHMNVANEHNLGASKGAGGGSLAAYFDGYMAEVYFIDGTQYAASDFGEFDEDSPTIWKPKDVSGLTFGNNGFYLDFEDSSNLGNDANGGTDLTEVNLAAADQATDTPTNNFATLNPLDRVETGTAFDLSEGNCRVVCAVNTNAACQSTIAVSSGKWYAEFKVTAVGANLTGGRTSVGVGSRNNTQVSGNYYGNTASPIDSYGKVSWSASYFSNNGSATSYGSTFVDDDIIGVYLDLDNNKLYFSENGTLYSSTGIDITAAASTFNGHYHIGVSDASTNDNTTCEANYGGCPSFAISSGNADDNGYGNFEYSPNITGDGSAKKFYSLCTKNLAEYG